MNYTAVYFSFLTAFIIDMGFSQSIPGTLDSRINKKDDSTTLALYSTIDQSSKEKIIGIRNTLNTGYSRGFNDGAVVKGKGLTTELHAGLGGKKGMFSYYLQPVLFFSQNLSNNLVSLSPNTNSYSYQLATIDWVQQYGDNAKFVFHPGQSEIKFEINKFHIGLSTQNYSFGPSAFNPILFSQQGAGFPHIRLGLNSFSLGKNIGNLEVNWLVGLLKESDYFDDIDDNDSRYINGLLIGFSPSFLKNLTIGFGKISYKQTRYFQPEDMLSPIYIFETRDREGINTGNDTFDQLASINMDWNFPSVGFRAYGEFGKNDFIGGYLWTALEPEHSRGYTIGFEKTINTMKSKQLTFLYEHTNLSRNSAFLWRATPTFYSHGINTQGYTHNGQIIGAGIGPGANSDHLLIALEDNLKMNKFNLLLQRIEYNRDYFVTSISNNPEPDAKTDFHNVEYSIGLNMVRKIRKVSFLGELIISHNFNRNFADNQSNINLAFGVDIEI